MDHAPIGYTCPQIDKIIDILKQIKDNDKLIQDEIEKEHPDIDNIVYLINGNIEDLEQLIEVDIENIRDANVVLREWGNSLFKEKDELEKENDDLKEKLDES